MAFPPSAEKALENLAANGSKEVLLAIKGVVSTAVAALNVTKIEKQAIKLSIEISLLPLTAQQEILKAAINTVKSATTVVPADLVREAPELGQINTLVASSLGATIEAAENALFEITRLKASASGVASEISSIDSSLTFFTDLETAIDKILNA